MRIHWLRMQRKSKISILTYYILRLAQIPNSKKVSRTVLINKLKTRHLRFFLTNLAQQVIAVRCKQTLSIKNKHSKYISNISQSVKKTPVLSRIKED